LLTLFKIEIDKIVLKVKIALNIKIEEKMLKLFFYRLITAINKNLQIQFLGAGFYVKLIQYKMFLAHAKIFYIKGRVYSDQQIKPYWCQLHKYVL
jgi:hypothetical protein